MVRAQPPGLRQGERPHGLRVATLSFQSHLYFHVTVIVILAPGAHDSHWCKPQGSGPLTTTSQKVSYVRYCPCVFLSSPPLTGTQSFRYLGHCFGRVKDKANSISSSRPPETYKLTVATMNSEAHFPSLQSVEWWSDRCRDRPPNSCSQGVLSDHEGQESCYTGMVRHDLGLIFPRRWARSQTGCAQLCLFKLKSILLSQVLTSPLAASITTFVSTKAVLPLVGVQPHVPANSLQSALCLAALTQTSTCR